ncbi:hypothetical protein NMY22_g10451 [Coprinellus aureogranulatus]|nr:hypothetical protein NMY22_g10451 [Coprinellus aureogranulatus]
MSGIGPQLPPHLQHLLGSSNAADDDSGDDVGPQPTAPTVGPQMPPGFGSSRVHDDEDDKAPSSGIGPAIPAHLLRGSSGKDPEGGGRSTTPPLERPSRPTPEPEPGPSTNRKVVGPTLPNYGPTYNPDTYGNVEDEEDSDDDVGPKPLPAGMKHEESNAVKEFIEREERMRKAREEAAKEKNAPKREEWMLVPPSSSDLLGNLDPTKLKKGRQFSKSTHSASSGPSDMSLWTETPAERQKRLEDEVMGRKRRAVDAANSEATEDPDKKRRKKEEAMMKREVEEYTVRAFFLSPSLASLQVDQHTKALDGKKDDSEGPPVIWDHARDMAIGGRLMDDDKRKAMVREARGLGDRYDVNYRPSIACDLQHVSFAVHHALLMDLRNPLSLLEAHGSGKRGEKCFPGASCGTHWVQPGSESEARNMRIRGTLLRVFPKMSNKLFDLLSVSRLCTLPSSEPQEVIVKDEPTWPVPLLMSDYRKAKADADARKKGNAGPSRHSPSKRTYRSRLVLPTVAGAKRRRTGKSGTPTKRVNVKRQSVDEDEVAVFSPAPISVSSQSSGTGERIPTPTAKKARLLNNAPSIKKPYAGNQRKSPRWGPSEPGDSDIEFVAMSVPFQRIPAKGTSNDPPAPSTIKREPARATLKIPPFKRDKMVQTDLFINDTENHVLLPSSIGNTCMESRAPHEIGRRREVRFALDPAECQETAYDYLERKLLEERLHSWGQYTGAEDEMRTIVQNYLALEKELAETKEELSKAKDHRKRGV